MTVGIYMIKNKLNNKIYIGQSINLERRITAHIRDFNKGTHRNHYLQRAWDKYGEENFLFTILEYCETDELDKKEMYYIKEFNSLVENHGYNLDTGGNLNRNFSKATRVKMSESRIGEKNGRAIITTKIAESLKVDMAKGISRNELVLKYNVSRSSLYNIATQKNWASVRSDLNETLKAIEVVKKEEKENEVLSLAKQGLTHQIISEKTGIPTSTITKILLRKGFTLPRKEESNFEKILYKKFNNLIKIKNFSVLRISNEIGISRNKIERILVRYSDIDTNDIPLYSNDEIKNMLLEQESKLEIGNKNILNRSINILQDRLDNMKLNDISEKYNVSVSHINDLINGHTLKSEPQLINLRNLLKKSTTMKKEERKIRNMKIVDLHVNQGHSRKEVAEIMGLTYNTVKSVIQSFYRSEKMDKNRNYH
ncbi:GIY-YIG nuclease family protein [Priestia megaterium]